jgi:biopolymer transport protein ExbD
LNQERPKRKRLESSPLDMSPFMDIIFILLIFVMLSISFQKKFTVMEMDLPSSIGSSEASEADLEISVFANGKIMIENKEISLEDLIINIQKNHPSRLRLNAERELSYENFIRITEKIKESGLEKIDLGLKLN